MPLQDTDPTPSFGGFGLRKLPYTSHLPPAIQCRRGMVPRVRVYTDGRRHTVLLAVESPQGRVSALLRGDRAKLAPLYPATDKSHRGCGVGSSVPGHSRAGQAWATHRDPYPVTLTSTSHSIIVEHDIQGRLFAGTPGWRDYLRNWVRVSEPNPIETVGGARPLPIYGLYAAGPWRGGLWRGFADHLQAGSASHRYRVCPRNRGVLGGHGHGDDILTHL